MMARKSQRSGFGPGPPFVTGGKQVQMPISECASRSQPAILRQAQDGGFVVVFGSNHYSAAPCDTVILAAQQIGPTYTLARWIAWYAEVDLLVIERRCHELPRNRDDIAKRNQVGQAYWQ